VAEALTAWTATFGESVSPTVISEVGPRRSAGARTADSGPLTKTHGRTASQGTVDVVLGYTNEGIIQIVISVFTCGIGGIIGLIEGIIYLTKSDEDFVRTYIQNKKGWF